MTRFHFCLYVMGQTSRSRNAEQQLRAVCDERAPGGYDIEVVDLADQLARADKERIVATPTLDRLHPPPRIRVIGDLGSVEQLSAVLDLPTEGAM